MGCHIYTYAKNIYLNAKKPLKPIRIIKTMPYPGFPTDAQAVTMAALCKANGTSVFEENIFENRYRHVDELLRMGANIKVVGRSAVWRELISFMEQRLLQQTCEVEQL